MPWLTDEAVTRSSPRITCGCPSTAKPTPFNVKSPRRPPRSLKKKTLPILSEVRVVSHPPLFRGRSLALVAWAGKHLSGKPIVADHYLPETVTTIRDLKERAQTYGCGTELGQGLRWLVECLRRHPPSGPFCVLVVLMARRPCNVIATHSPIEVCPYVLDVVPPDMSLDDATTAVRPAATSSCRISIASRPAIRR